MNTIHASVQTASGLAQLRDLEESDFEHIARYWFENDDTYLDNLGIDRKLLGRREDIQDRFRRAIPSGDANQSRFAFAVLLEDNFIGYTVLNRIDAQNNYSHWHITDAKHRRAGLSTALYPWRIRAYFDAAPLERLIHRTRTSNLGVNRMLDKFVPVAKTVHVEHSDGVALPGEFHLRYVHREDVPRLFEIATRHDYNLK